MKNTLLYIQRKAHRLYQVARQSHAFYLALYIIDGSACIEIDRKLYHFPANTLLVYPPGTLHAERHDNDSRFSHFVLGFTGAPHLPVDLRVIPDTPDRRIYQVLCWLEEFMGKGLAGKALEPFVEVFTVFLEEALELTPRRETDARAALVSTVMAYIAENLGKKLTLAELAERVHVSESHLEYLFKEQLSRSPISFVMEGRIALARALLAENALPVKTIACQCGFSDQRYFARFFKQYCGSTPTEYRRQARKT